MDSIVGNIAPGRDFLIISDEDTIVLEMEERNIFGIVRELYNASVALQTRYRNWMSPTVVRYEDEDLLCSNLGSYSTLVQLQIMWLSCGFPPRTGRTMWFDTGLFEEVK